MAYTAEDTASIKSKIDEYYRKTGRYPSKDEIAKITQATYGPQLEKRGRNKAEEARLAIGYGNLAVQKRQQDLDLKRMEEAKADRQVQGISNLASTGIQGYNVLKEEGIIKGTPIGDLFRRAAPSGISLKPTAITTKSPLATSALVVDPALMSSATPAITSSFGASASATPSLAASTINANPALMGSTTRSALTSSLGSAESVKAANSALASEAAASGMSGLATAGIGLAGGIGGGILGQAIGGRAGRKVGSAAGTGLSVGLATGNPVIGVVAGLISAIFG